VENARPAIFLDRDGTIIVEREYLADPADVALERGAAEGLRRLQHLGWPLVVVSNQSGVGRGYFPESAVHAVNARVADLLRAEGVTIAGWYHCPHAPDDRCACRKPADGMIRQASADLGLDPTRSVMIGDKPSDVELAHRIRAIGILLETGHDANGGAEATVVCATLIDAAAFVLEAVKETPSPP